MAEWSRPTATTIRKYIKGFEDETMRSRKVPALLKKNGRIKYSSGGLGVDWKVKWKRAELQVNGGDANIDFAPIDRFKTAFLDYKGYAISDSMSKREKLMNTGPEAIIKYYKEIVPQLLSDIEDKFHEEFYIDSGATGNSNRMSGINTLFGTPTQTYTISSGAARTANDADVSGVPVVTSYAGLSTVPGALGGSWNTQTGIADGWPAGKGDEEYDFWSPMLINFGSTAWTGTGTWASAALHAIRYGLTHGRRNNSKRGAIDMVMVDRDLYRVYLHLLDGKERINTTDVLGLRALGFEDVVNQDGVAITSEYGIPANTGFGWNMDQVELLSMQDQLFVPEGPDYDIATRTDRFAIDILGQIKFQSPRHFFKLLDMA